MEIQGGEGGPTAIYWKMSPQGERSGHIHYYRTMSLCKCMWEGFVCTHLRIRGDASIIRAPGQRWLFACEGTQYTRGTFSWSSPLAFKEGGGVGGAFRTGDHGVGRGLTCAPTDRAEPGLCCFAGPPSLTMTSKLTSFKNCIQISCWDRELD